MLGKRHDPTVHCATSALTQYVYGRESCLSSEKCTGISPTSMPYTVVGQACTSVWGNLRLPRAAAFGATGRLGT